MRNDLSQKERRLRLEALAQALRQFNLTDDGVLSQLVCKARLPSTGALARVLSQSCARLPLGVSKEFVAQSIIAQLSARDEQLSNFEDPFSTTPNVGPISQDQLHPLILKLLQEYKLAVEDRRGYILLWEGAESKDESAAQALFDLAVRGWSTALGLDLQAEVNLGRGPVDFRVSNGPWIRAVIEMKLARNSGYWTGLRKQLPTYMRVDGLLAGYFVTVVFTNADAIKLRGIDGVIDSVRLRTGYEITSVVVDARRTNKTSASRA